jgi:glucokinase
MAKSTACGSSKVLMRASGRRKESPVTRVLGMDLGGTHLRAGLLDTDGRLRGVVRHEVPADPAASAEFLVRVAEGFGDIDAAGLAIAGVVADGVVTWSAKRDLDGLPAAAVLRRVTSGPVVVINDARAAGIAEARREARPGEHVVLALTVGTGIGGAVVIDGVPLAGTGGAGEVGHLVIRPDGPPCRCGRQGCWETLAGGRALDRVAALTLGVDTAKAADLEGHADSNSAAAAALAQAATDFRTGLDNLCAVLAPHVVVLGGGILARDGVIGRAYLAAAQHMSWAGTARIVRSSLGDHAGLFGAAVLAAELL